jgi:hypothetical protein
MWCSRRVLGAALALSMLASSCSAEWTATNDCRPLMLLLDEDGEAPNDAKRYPSIGVGAATA